MSTVELKQETYLPEPDGQELARVFDFLRAHEQAGKGQIAPRYLLVGPDSHDQVELPPEVYRILLQVVDAMSHGLAVTVAPQSQTLTTQQAADLLGISRPTLIRLLDAEQVPYERVGTHRRLLLRDVLEFRERRREEQYRMLAETSVEVGEENVADVLESLREARRQVAERRWSRRTV